MFYYLNGTVAHIEPHIAVIDCGGVGYLCNVSLLTQSSLKIGEKAKLFTYLYVREDAMELYGFADMQEKNCFLQLTGVTGVGVKAALAVLSSMSPEKFALAVLNNDEKALTSVPGIGKKIAQRIILELHDKLKKEFAGGIDLSSGTKDTVQITADVSEEALMALQVLGYSASEASAALRKTDMTLPLEDVIRAALKNLAKN